jgi:hypothetical protein
MVIINFATILFIPALPDYPPPVEYTGARSTGAERSATPLIAIAALAIFLQQMSRFCGGSFIFGVGSSFGLSREVISTSLGVTTWLAALGTVGPVMLANRFGRLRPVMIATGISFAFSVLLIGAGHNLVVWWSANAVSGFATMVSLPYFFGICSALDPSGRSSTWTAFFSKIGMAMGPTFGAWVLQETHFVRLLWVSAGLGLFSVLLWAWPGLSMEKVRLQTEG